ncbi:hypothetical protein H634G_10927 [Metarhizium anisopliae BRIP 53293]|uniref:Uncharacterized protein n=1 Tax=Metarhizium anisopliae BRIP 53293 TaxID=1291518 RepID=A0A0D9NJ75_METAN|nr:hypothetical protein H634G_10927 [Metarhizium anisopliae BRIP 53293]
MGCLDRLLRIRPTILSTPSPAMAIAVNHYHGRLDFKWIPQSVQTSGNMPKLLRWL